MFLIFELKGTCILVEYNGVSLAGRRSYRQLVVLECRYVSDVFHDYTHCWPSGQEF